MARDQFTFYRSFWDALRLIKNKNDRLSLLEAVIAYALDEEERELTGTVASCFFLIKPTLDASAKKAKSGKVGGNAKQSGSKTEANAKQSGSKTEANEKQSGSKTEANAKQSGREKEGEKEKEVEKEVEVEVEKENECYIPCSSEQGANAREAGSLPKRRYGQYALLEFHEYCELLNTLGHSELSRRINLVDLPENDGKDFFKLISEVRE